MANIKEFDYLKMFYDIRKVCMTEAVCGTCADYNCLVGYCREMIGKAKKRDTDTLRGDFQRIPAVDTKGGYDMPLTLDAIAHSLQQCRSCKDRHDPDCLVNIIRSCYEVIAFGEEQHYDGSTFKYLVELQKEHPNEAAHISEIYSATEEKHLGYDA